MIIAGPKLKHHEESLFRCERIMPSSPDVRWFEMSILFIYKKHMVSKGCNLRGFTGNVTLTE